MINRVNKGRNCLFYKVGGDTSVVRSFFLSERSLVASIISFFVRAVSRKLKVFGFCEILLVGHIFEGLIF